MPDSNDTSNGIIASTRPADVSSSAPSGTPTAPFPTASQTRGGAQPAAGASAGPDVKQAADAAKDAIDDAGQASDDLMKRLVTGAHSAIDKLADAATPTIDRLKNTFGNPTDKLSRLAGQAGDKKDEWVSDVRDIVRENPLAAIATALVVGAIYVKLTSSSRAVPPDSEDD